MSDIAEPPTEELQATAVVGDEARVPSAAPPPADRARGLAVLRDIATTPASPGLYPLVVMALLAAAARVDMASFCVLRPDIRNSCQLANAGSAPPAPWTAA